MEPPLSHDVPVFAYGSNLSKSQMNERDVQWDCIEIAHLPDHTLVFRGKSTRQEYEGGGLADIEAKVGAYVMGVIYWTSGELGGLDTGEGVCLKYPKGCYRVQVTVNTDRGLVVSQTYVRKSKDAQNRPHEKYLARIIKGAKEHGLPEEWIQMITAIAYQSGSS